MNLNAEQEAAVRLAHEIRKNAGVGIVAGPAGCGKSFLLKAVCDEVGKTILVAPTNRAAKRVAGLTGQTASTIHGWLYRAVDTPTGVRFVRRHIDQIPIPPSNLVVVDESSMLGPDVWQDIWDIARECGLGILLVGDPFQLPPVVAEGTEFSVFDSDFAEAVGRAGVAYGRVDLVHVFRQAAESAIIRAVTELRKYPTDWVNTVKIIENRPSRDNDSKDGYGFPHPRNVPARVSGLLEDGRDHCVISYTNEKRHSINRSVRALRGWDNATLPQPGEPLLVRRNSKGAAVSNGEIITFRGFVEPPVKVGVPEQFRFFEVNGALCLTSVDMIATGVVPQQRSIEGYKWPFIECNYGYATTAHASQGHEFDLAIVFWESILMQVYRSPTMRARWLYTAFSRAKTKLLIGGLED